MFKSHWLVLFCCKNVLYSVYVLCNFFWNYIGDINFYLPFNCWRRYSNMKVRHCFWQRWILGVSWDIRFMYFKEAVESHRIVYLIYSLDVLYSLAIPHIVIQILFYHEAYLQSFPYNIFFIKDDYSLPFIRFCNNNGFILLRAL